jgi:hypothetical protein
MRRNHDGAGGNLIAAGGPMVSAMRLSQRSTGAHFRDA